MISAALLQMRGPMGPMMGPWMILFWIVLIIAIVAIVALLLRWR